jgi:hypothetical protein
MLLKQTIEFNVFPLDAFDQRFVDSLQHVVALSWINDTCAPLLLQRDASVS